MAKLWVKKSIFNEYFKLLYKIQYNFCIYHVCEKEDYDNMDVIQKELKEEIKSVFLKSIEKGEKIKLDKKYHKLSIGFNGDDFNSGENYETNLYKETNKIVLYYHLLFTPNILDCFDCFEYWFAEGNGCYPKYKDINPNTNIAINQCINSNLIDPVGSYLKQYVNYKGSDDFTNEEIEEIFTFKSLSPMTENNLKNKYAKYMYKFDYYFNSKLTPHIVGEVEYVDLIELFDIFFLINYNYIYDDNKEYIGTHNALKLHSTDNSGISYFVNEGDDYDYETANLFENNDKHKKNTDPDKLIKIIKNTLDCLDKAVDGVCESEKMDLQCNFITALKQAVFAYFD